MEISPSSASGGGPAPERLRRSRKAWSALIPGVHDVTDAVFLDELSPGTTCEDVDAAAARLRRYLLGFDTRSDSLKDLLLVWERGLLLHCTRTPATADEIVDVTIDARDGLRVTCACASSDMVPLLYNFTTSSGRLASVSLRNRTMHLFREGGRLAAERDGASASTEALVGFIKSCK